MGKLLQENRKSKLKIDFGSGYNPKEGYKTCDIKPYPNLDYLYTDGKIQGLNELVDTFRLKNVMHHLFNIEKVMLCLKSYLKSNGYIEIIEPSKESYQANYFLDRLWYRFVIPQDIYISPVYRDYKQIMKNIGFVCTKEHIIKEKEKTFWKFLY